MQDALLLGLLKSKKQILHTSVCWIRFLLLSYSSRICFNIAA